MVIPSSMLRHLTVCFYVVKRPKDERSDGNWLSTIIYYTKTKNQLTSVQAYQSLVLPCIDVLY